MKPLIYPAVAIVLNTVLLQSFPMAGGGASLGILLTIPAIALITILIMTIHYILEKKNIKTKYFQMMGIIAIVLTSYSLFIKEEGDTPFDIIGRMFKTAGNYNKIGLSDLYLENIPVNAEKILAARKKFRDQIPDTAYTISVFRNTDVKTIESLGIFYRNGKPIPVNRSVKIRQINKTAIMLTRIIKNDTLTFILAPLEIKKDQSTISGFPEESTKGKPEKDLRFASIEMINKNTGIDNEYFAYKVFYWLL